MSKSNAALKKEDETHLELVEGEGEQFRQVLKKLESLESLKDIDTHLQSLWKLDKLDRLAYLAELQRLDKLGELDKLAHLQELGKLDNLRFLKDLKQLTSIRELDKLDKLHHLIRLKYLDRLEELRGLHRLGELDKLNKLSQLDKLSYLNKLDELKKIEKLSALNKLDDLRLLLEQHGDAFEKLENLKHIERLDALKQLKSLEKLESLQSLEGLSNLEKLNDLSKLEKLTRLRELENLEKLENLSSLDRLHKLDELRHLEKLENMQDLSKLDYLKDSKVQTALLGLEKMSFFQESSGKFFVKLFSSIFVDPFKVAAIASLMFFVFTKNISRQTFDRLIPYLGFGEADRVNIALSILAKDLSYSDFELHYKNLESRVKREVASIFDARIPKNLDHYRTMENLTAYNYKQDTFDLNAFAKKELNEWGSKTHEKFLDSYGYDIEMAGRNPDNRADVQRLTSASIFMKQQKFLEAFVEMDQIKNKHAFESLGHGISYAFYMAFQSKPVDLKVYLGK